MKTDAFGREALTQADRDYKGSRVVQVVRHCRFTRSRLRACYAASCRLANDTSFREPSLALWILMRICVGARTERVSVASCTRTGFVLPGFGRLRRRQNTQVISAKAVRR